MDRRALRNFVMKRSTIWTMSLCMTGALVLGGIAAVDGARRGSNEQEESELDQMAYLEEEVPDDIEDELFPTLNLDGKDELAQASGNTVEEIVDEGVPGVAEQIENAGAVSVEAADAANVEATDAANVEATDAANVEAADAANVEAAALTPDADEAASSSILSEQVMIDAGVSFSEEDSLMWPSAGTILIDYSMDGTVYFPTLRQYKYNPAVVIASETGNQVLASAKGIVESVGIDEETGTTLVLNLGSGYRLTYGQLKELAVAEGDVVAEGDLLGYVSEPTKYYSEDGSNLYFAMTKDDVPVDPVLYLE